MSRLSLIKWPGSGGGSGSGGTAVTADSGVSVQAGVIVLGQLLGAASNPGKLLQNTEIPLNSSSLTFSGIGNNSSGVLDFKKDPAADGSFTPYFQFLDSSNTVLAALRIDSTGAIYFGSNNGTTATGRQNFSFGPNAMDRCTTIRDSIFIGAQAGSGAGVVTPAEKIIIIGADAADMGIGFDIGSYCVIIGANSGDAGAFNIGAQNLWIGHFINNGATILAGDTGALNILIGNAIGTGGGVTNLTIIGHDFQSAVSNVALIGRPDQNTIIGAPLTGQVDNGAKLQVLGSITTANPGTGVGKWLLGQHHAAVVTFNTTGYLEVNVDGVVYKVALTN